MRVLRRLGCTAGAMVSASVVASVLTAGAAQAATTYVVDNTNASCTDAGAGTLAQPFCTITAAAAKAVAGDTVAVNGGPYAGGTSVTPANSGASGSPITFTASPGVTITGGTRAFTLSSRNFIVINGFTVTNTTSYGIFVSGSSNDVVSNNTVSGTASYGINVTGGSSDVVSNNNVSSAGKPVSGSQAFGIFISNLAGGSVTGNASHDNSAHGIELTGTTTGVTIQGNSLYHNAFQWQRAAVGIEVLAAGNFIIGNLTYSNEDSGIEILASNTLVSDNVSFDNGDHGIDNRNLTANVSITGGQVTGNTVYYNCTDGINVEGLSTNYVIENNIAVDNATGAIINPTPIAPGAPANDCKRRTGNIGVYDSAPATATANYNLVWQDGAGVEYEWNGTGYATQAALNTAVGQEANGIFANPLLANPQHASTVASGLQLKAGSPAIDSADSGAAGEQATDLLGNSRFDVPTVTNTGIGPRAYDDRGAFEFQPPPSAVAVAALGTNGVPYAQAPQLGAGWHSLGGTVTAVPAVAAAPNPNGSTPAKPWFIAPGTNHLLYIRGVTGSWVRLGPNDTSCLSAAAVITNNVLQVACETTAHGLSYNTAAIPSSGLPQFTAQWKSLGGNGTIAAGPAVTRVNGALTFFVLATDGKIHTRTITGSFTPTGWACAGQPAVATQATTGESFFACQGTNHGLFEATNTGSGWSSLTQLAGTLAAGPGIAATSAGQVLLLEGTNHNVYQGTPGSTFTKLGSLTVTGVEAAALN
jgi:parallel beta-helix repeat protein